jgi:predicted PurR-regulated permease PerM
LAVVVDRRKAAILRPILIRKGGDLPLLLILVGVIGGLLTFGLIGLFIGHTILAFAYRRRAGRGERLAKSAPGERRSASLHEPAVADDQ